MAASGLPSPSKSPILIPLVPEVPKDLKLENELSTKLPAQPGNVTLNGTLVYAERPALVTLIGWKVAPAGTVTESEVVVALLTVAFTAPKNTVLLEGVALNPVPDMVTSVPIGPEAGENDVMAGCA